MSVSEPNLAETPKISRKEIVSDSNIYTKSSFYETAKENTPNSPSKFKRQNSTTRVSSHIPGSPQPQLKTLNIQRDDFNMEIKLVATDDVKVEVEIQERSEDDGSDSENKNGSNGDVDKGGIREQARSKLQRLGKLYGGKFIF